MAPMQCHVCKLQCVCRVRGVGSSSVFSQDVYMYCKLYKSSKKNNLRGSRVSPHHRYLARVQDVSQTCYIVVRYSQQPWKAENCNQRAPRTPLDLGTMPAQRQDHSSTCRHPSDSKHAVHNRIHVLHCLCILARHYTWLWRPHTSNPDCPETSSLQTMDLAPQIRHWVRATNVPAIAAEPIY